MTENPTNGFSAPTRRLLIQAAIGAVGAAGAIAARSRSAAADPTISKEAVAYQDEPQGDKECDKCARFVAPSGCVTVEGTISPHGYCRIFRPVG
jgi:hypothetical protein